MGAVTRYLFIFFASEPSVGISDTDAQLLSTFNEHLAVLGRYSMGDFSAEFLVLHHQNFEFLDIVDKNFSETNGKHVLGGFCGAKTNVRHNIHSLEASSHSVVDTFRLTPVLIYIFLFLCTCMFASAHVNVSC